jgi:hypothetical protein
MDEEQLQQQQPKAKDNFRRWDDPLFEDLRRIFSRAKLREVLTHSSFYEQSPLKKSTMLNGLTTGLF